MFNHYQSSLTAKATPFGVIFHHHKTLLGCTTFRMKTQNSCKLQVSQMMISKITSDQHQQLSPAEDPTTLVADSLPTREVVRLDITSSLLDQP